VVPWKNSATPLLKGGTDAGRVVMVKGWPWGSGSQMNTVVTFLYWKGWLGALP